MWAAGYQAKAQLKAFDRFAGDAISAIRDEAHMLVAISNKQDFGCRVEQARAMLQTISAIEENVGLFDRNVASTRFANYDVQRWLSRLVNQLTMEKRVMERARAFLEGNVTIAVIANAQRTLALVGGDIKAACEAVTRELDYTEETPSADEVAIRIAKLVEVQDDDGLPF